MSFGGGINPKKLVKQQRRAARRGGQLTPPPGLAQIQSTAILPVAPRRTMSQGQRAYRLGPTHLNDLRSGYRSA